MSLENKKLLTLKNIIEAHKRISNYITETPLLNSPYINEKVANNIYFKAECLQKTGSFKLRGVFNKLLHLKENNQLPKKIVTFSSGNHGQGLAYACKELDIKYVTVYMTTNSSTLKQEAIKSYGANVVLKTNRNEIHKQIEEDVKNGAYYVPTSDDDMIIAGQGTSCLEALKSKEDIDIIFAPCGGGGLISGTYLASSYNNRGRKVFAVEPTIANDAQISYNTGKIFKFDKEVKDTIADGVRTPCVSNRTFQYIKNLDGMIDVSEEEIIYWTQLLTNTLEITIEPTSAMTMAGCHKWLKENPDQRDKNILVVLSGGNVSKKAHNQIWERNLLEKELKDL